MRVIHHRDSLRSSGGAFSFPSGAWAGRGSAATGQATGQKGASWGLALARGRCGRAA